MLRKCAGLCRLLKNLNDLHISCLHTNAFLMQDEKNVDISKFTKYKPYCEEQSPIIFDVEEEKKRSKGDELNAVIDDFEKFPGISKERGKEGVIDIQELVKVLRNQNAVDVFVARVPAEYRYVQYMVVVSGKSARHMLGMIEYVRRVYKYKTNNDEPPPHIEGKKSQDWIALDLGNIALHVFSIQKRIEYDLESLWSVGSDHDRMVKTPDDDIFVLKDSNHVT